MLEDKEPLLGRGSNDIQDFSFSGETSFSPSDWLRENWRWVLIIIGGAFASLVAGSTNAFNAFSQAIQDTNSMSNSEINLVAGLGLIGMYFVVPAGWALDKYGPSPTAILGALLTAAGYLGMSFAPKGAWWIILVGLTTVGFGSGAVFLAVLGTSISCSPSGGGWGVSIVSAGMSLSIAFIIHYTQLFAEIVDCHGDSCWREWFRAIAIVAAVFMLPGSVLMSLFRKQDYPHLIENHGDDIFASGIGHEIEDHECEDRTPDDDPRRREATLTESLKIAVSSPLFWVLFVGYFCGIASAVFVLTQTTQLWESYTDRKSLLSWDTYILTIFSFTNAFANVFNGVLSDYLSKNKIMSHHSFVAIVQLMFAVVFAVLAILVQMEIQTVVAALLLAFVGFGFGTYLVLFPIVIAETYGPTNFGKYFGYLQIASSTASVAIPQIASVMHTHFGNYRLALWIMSGMLFVSSFFMFIKTLLKNIFQYELK